MAEPVVVVIEDEPQIRRFLRAALTGQGYRLFEADTGEDGLIEVEILRWVPGHDHEPSYWSRVGRGVTLIDTVEKARAVAVEELATAR